MCRFWPFYLVALLLIGAGARDQFDRWIADTDLPSVLLETSPEIRDRNGNLLRAYTVADGIWRLPARLNEVDATYVELLLAYEDHRFYDHAGVDGWALARAVIQAIGNGRVVSGGSTLTMQVARLLEDSGTGKLSGKFRQMRVALAIEQHLTKAEILDLYLLLAPMGGNLEGLRSGSLAWFKKEPMRLTVAQAALMVALPQSPSARRPDRFPFAAQTSRDRVLARAVDAGVLSQEEATAALSEPVPKQRGDFPLLAPHLSDRALAERPNLRAHFLTLDAPLQSALETLADTALFGLGERLSIAMVVADHQTGEILASVGSAGIAQSDYRQGFVDMTQARRSPGSTLKPLIYGLSFDQGLTHPNTLIRDMPVKYGTYAPQNFDGEFRGEITVADSLKQSRNVPVVTLTHELGPANLMAALRAAGTHPVVPGGAAGLAVSLGGVGMTLEELVQLYATFARGGVAGELSWRMGEKNSEKQRVISPSAAWSLGHILSGIAPPPGAPANRLAYKTGTSYGHRDTWAIGYDGSHVAGVWIGRPDGTPVPGAFGAEVAAPVLFDMFQRLKPELDRLGPPPPETILLATAQLPEPLRKFRGRNALFEAPEEGLKMVFPPHGAQLSGVEQELTIKLKNGTRPFTVLANGVPLVTGQRRHEIALPNIGRGASTLTVIDALGISDRVEIWID